MTYYHSIFHLLYKTNKILLGYVYSLLIICYHGFSY